ncbi:MAG: hypothetical protein ACYDD0_11625 [Candidatus Dormibacteria bacterium]
MSSGRHAVSAAAKRPTDFLHQEATAAAPDHRGDDFRHPRPNPHRATRGRARGLWGRAPAAECEAMARPPPQGLTVELLGTDAVPLDLDEPLPAMGDLHFRAAGAACPEGSLPMIPSAWWLANPGWRSST